MSKPDDECECALPPMLDIRTGCATHTDDACPFYVDSGGPEWHAQRKREIERGLWRGNPGAPYGYNLLRVS